jgi:hypothetical protein
MLFSLDVSGFPCWNALSLGMARVYAGVNTSALADNQAYDEASGTAILFGTPVTVEPLTQRPEL